MQIVSGKERKIKMDKKEFALNQHEKWNGKIEVISRAKIESHRTRYKIWVISVH